MSEPISDEAWEEFTTAVARAAMNAGFDGAFVTGFVGHDDDEGNTFVVDRAALVNDPRLNHEAKEAVKQMALESIGALDFSEAGEEDNPTEHKTIDLATDDVDRVVTEAEAFLGDPTVCKDCGAKKKPIPPPEGAVELRDALSRLILDSGLVKVANFNIVFKNGCEDVNVTPACGCGDTTGKCFAIALHTFAGIVEDVAELVEAGEGYNAYDGEGSEELVSPVKH